MPLTIIETRTPNEPACHIAVTHLTVLQPVVNHQLTSTGDRCFVASVTVGTDLDLPWPDHLDDDCYAIRRPLTIWEGREHIIDVSHDDPDVLELVEEVKSRARSEAETCGAFFAHRLTTETGALSFFEGPL